jgi:uncharacterized protein
MHEPEELTEKRVVERTKHWLEKAVIGLNLCPFAKAVHVKQQIRYVVTLDHNPQAVHAHLRDELLKLHATPAELVDTTLIIHPNALVSFMAYVDYLQEADELLSELGLEGELQIASFHPDYEFGDASAADAAHCTNRSPFPTLHLLREASIDKAVAAFPSASDIYERNIDTLRALGTEGYAKLLNSL